MSSIFQPEDDPLVCSKPEDLPPSLGGAAPWFAQVAEQGFLPCLLLSKSGDAERRARVKRRHDVKSALRTFGFSVKALESGYRFDDDKAKAKIDAIAKALAILERECELLLQSALRD